MSNEKLLKRANKILEAGLNSAVADEGRWRIEEMRIHMLAKGVVISTTAWMVFVTTLGKFLLSN